MSAPMQQLVLRPWTVILLAGLLSLTSCRTFFKEKPYEETSGKRGWHPFLHPAQKNLMPNSCSPTSFSKPAGTRRP